jgi:hypothetical protein
LGDDFALYYNSEFLILGVTIVERIFMFKQRLGFLFVVVLLAACSSSTPNARIGLSAMLLVTQS